MDSALTTVGLPVALAIIMFGLGLTVGDFRRIAQHPKPAVVALACQLAAPAVGAPLTVDVGRDDGGPATASAA